MTNETNNEVAKHAGMWPKGTSGNPGGYSKEKRAANRHLSELIRAHTEEIYGMLMDIAKNGESEAARVEALKELTNRGWGRSVNTTELVVEQLDAVPTFYDLGRRMAFVLQAAVVQQDDKPAQLSKGEVETQ